MAGTCGDASLNHRNQPSVVHPVAGLSIYWLTFSTQELIIHKTVILCTFRSQFTSEKLSKKFKNTDVCVILNLKWQQPEMLVLKP